MIDGHSTELQVVCVWRPPEMQRGLVNGFHDILYLCGSLWFTHLNIDIILNYDKRP